MSISTKCRNLKFLVCAAGLLGALLRFVLYTTGTDEKGLLVRGHWASVSTWLLTGVMLAALLLFCRSLRGPKKYAHCYPVSVFGALCCLLAALCFTATAMTEYALRSAQVDTISALLSLLSAPALLCVGVCRLHRTKPSFLFHALVCVAFALRMVTQYRLWNSDPQLHNYLFSMGAHMALMLTAYQLAAFDADMGSHRAVWFWGLLSAYFCFVSCYGSRNPLYMISWGLWALSSLPRLEVPIRRHRPPLVPEDEPAREE